MTANAKAPGRMQAWAMRAFDWACSTGLVVAVAADSFIGSYGHIVALLQKYGQFGWHAYTSAGLADTLCVIGAEYYRRDKRTHEQRRRLGRVITYPAFLILTGVTVSFYANWETVGGAASDHLAAVWPCYVLVLIVGLMEWIRARKAEAAAGTGGKRKREHGNPEHRNPGTGSGNPGTAAGNPAGTGSGNPRKTGSGGGGDGRDRQFPAPPEPPRPEPTTVVIPDGYAITGPHSVEDEARAARAAAAAFMAANGRRPKAEELGKMCCRRKSWALVHLRALNDGQGAGAPERKAVNA